MNDVVLWAALLGVAATAVVAVVAWLKSRTGERNLSQEVRQQLADGREESRAAAKELREEVLNGLRLSAEWTAKSLESAAKAQIEGLAAQLRVSSEAQQTALERLRTVMEEGIERLREDHHRHAGALRQESAEGLRLALERLGEDFQRWGTGQQQQLEGMNQQLREIAQSQQTALERIRATFDERIRQLQESNEKKLEEMRRTVDEKLHDTLERRLGESFQLVSDRLEAVHQGLGEMQNLATGVGELKRVLSNVKVRGTWAEVQLGALLDQVLTSEQYGKNVNVRPDRLERVEYAVRLPGARGEAGSKVWLPIDSKFPQEDYLRLQEAADRGDAVAVQAATEALARSVRNAAREIHDKYIHPPETTDFGIMFLATEGLYAEVLRQPALLEELLQKYRVVVAGPTTLAAILSSLRLGFQTLAIEQRAAEVWQVLGAVKSEFRKFGEVLAKVQKHLHTASRSIEETGKRSRAIERKLIAVAQLPEAEAAAVLELGDGRPEIEDGGEEPDNGAGSGRESQKLGNYEESGLSA
jgi:DNA recombination protein RmuC